MIDAMNWLQGHREGPYDTYLYPLDGKYVAGAPDPLRMEVLARLCATVDRRWAAAPPPALRWNEKRYQRTIGLLHEKELVAPIREAKERIGLFAVWKERGARQRPIVDARRSNARFKPPPWVDLLSSEGLGRVAVELDEDFLSRPEERQSFRGARIAIGSADVRDCFHRMKVPSCMSEYFALPPVPAACFGMTGMIVDGRALLPTDGVPISWAVLPMGFT